MTSKFKIEYYHKLPQTTSPYLQLLEAKKKIFGYKYELIRTDKPNYQHNKSIGHTNSQPSHKQSKTQSHQKQKPKSQKQHSRKKRSQTEQAEQRLHESLFLNRDTQTKESKHQATKSLFTIDGNIDQSINPHDFMRNYKNALQGDEKNIKSLTQQVDSKVAFFREKAPRVNPLEKLETGEIDDLINLIDNCVQEANDYISYLTEKIEALKAENSTMKEQQMKLLKMKDGIINEKEVEIHRLRKELHGQGEGQRDSEKAFEIKKLLEVINKMGEENTTMKAKLREYEMVGEARSSGKEYLVDKDKKDIYNSIHNKIDILNIAIDKKDPGEGGEQELVRERQKKIKNNNRPRFYK